MNQPKEPSTTSRWQGVLDAARAVYRFCDEKIGWNRIGVAISITIIGVALIVLFRILRGIDAGDVLRAIVMTDTQDIVVAALLIAGAYFTLTFYDLFALRTIG